MRPLVTPSAKYYLVALGLLLLGAAAGYRFHERRVPEIVAGLDRGIFPGTLAVDLSTAGHHAVFLEYRSAIGSELFLTSAELGDLECALVSRRTGAPVDLRRTWLPLRYSVEERAGMQVFDFWIEEPGPYELSARYPEGKPGPQLVLAVGGGFLGDPRELPRTGLGFAALCVVAGLLVAVIVLVRRERSRKGIYGRFGR